MQLWSDEIDAMRPEARDAVTSGMEAMRAMIGNRAAIDPNLDKFERAKQQREMFAVSFVPAPEAVERQIAGVRCRVFTPEQQPARAVYLHFHGGGMILGAPEMNDTANAELSRRTGMAVVSVDYRMAPEDPYPAGPDDGVAVAAWLLEHGEDEFGSARILIGGESAGGYMAAAVLLRIRDELGAADRVDGANLVFGVYDWGRPPSQRGMRPSDIEDILDPGGIVFFGDCYLPGLTDDERRAPEISPAFADLSNLPPALMSVGSADHLLDDTLMLAPRWVAAGNEVELFVAPDMPHGFGAYACGITDAWNARTRAWFDDILARPARASAG
jgi:acetyl esterase/lipase